LQVGGFRVSPVEPLINYQGRDADTHVCSGRAWFFHGIKLSKSTSSGSVASKEDWALPSPGHMASRLRLSETSGMGERGQM
jgi:hypothetical protein